MNEKEFKKLLKKDKYQVFVFSSRLTLPLSFATHTWIVVSDKEKTSRLEISFFRDSKGRKEGYFYFNALKPTKGIRIFPHSKKVFWESKLIGIVEGKKGSIAHKINSFFKRDYKKYPFPKIYMLLGPNSNTFVQWVLNKFPKAKIKLPKNAFGKKYKQHSISSPILLMSHLSFEPQFYRKKHQSWL